jgi:hypothetical protein
MRSYPTGESSELTISADRRSRARHALDLYDLRRSLPSTIWMVNGDGQSPGRPHCRYALVTIRSPIVYLPLSGY